MHPLNKVMDLMEGSLEDNSKLIWDDVDRWISYNQLSIAEVSFVSIVIMRNEARWFAWLTNGAAEIFVDEVRQWLLAYNRDLLKSSAKALDDCFNQRDKARGKGAPQLRLL